MVSASMAHPPVPPSLSIPHRNQLEVHSGIHPAIIAEHGYRTVKADGMRTQFPDDQRKDGLVIPTYTVWGQVGFWQVKPYEPRLKDDKPVTCETIPRQPLCIDAPTQVPPHLGNPQVSQGHKPLCPSASAPSLAFRASTTGAVQTRPGQDRPAGYAPRARNSTLNRASQWAVVSGDFPCSPPYTGVSG